MIVAKKPVIGTPHNIAIINTTNCYEEHFSASYQSFCRFYNKMKKVTGEIKD
jgi:hypothetical protein